MAKMTVHIAEFLKSAVTEEHYPPEDLPEVAIAGRSNVGKSSLINSIVGGRKKVAVTSGTPGRTRLINFFDINTRVRLVDLPGYGYAKASKKEREKWQRMIDAYLRSREALQGIVVIIDVRHDPSPLDEQMLEYVTGLELPTIVVFTKCDKVPRGKLKNRARQLARDLDIPEDAPVLFSAVSGLGTDDLWGQIADVTGMTLAQLAKKPVD
jgi:GTP-binding protein